MNNLTQLTVGFKATLGTVVTFILGFISIETINKGVALAGISTGIITTVYTAYKTYLLWKNNRTKVIKIDKEDKEDLSETA